MKMRWFLAIMAALSAGCTFDRYPSRVDVSKQTVVSFLIRYTRVQTEAFELRSEYDQNLAPQRGSILWPALDREYLNVRSYLYTCQFDISRAAFKVGCTPEPGSGMRLAFYIDETRSLRLSADGAAGPDSPRLRLSSNEEEELLGRHKPH